MILSRVYLLYGRSRTEFFICCLMIGFNLLMLLSTVSCGRRGDPFLPTPDKISREKGAAVSEDKKQEGEEVKVNGNVWPDKPVAPSGLVGVFTGSSVVISWAEIKGQGVKSYNVYRSDGGEYKKVGETIIPAFIDENIRMKSSYRYRVSAVGKSESEFSKEVEIKTEEK
jgi:predicted small lipoprotein YifL